MWPFEVGHLAVDALVGPGIERTAGGCTVLVADSPAWGVSLWAMDVQALATTSRTDPAREQPIRAANARLLQQGVTARIGGSSAEARHQSAVAATPSLTSPPRFGPSGRRVCPCRRCGSEDGQEVVGVSFWDSKESCDGG
jgi:hypothetical protein